MLPRMLDQWLNRDEQDTALLGSSGAAPLLITSSVSTEVNNARNQGST